MLRRNHELSGRFVSKLNEEKLSLKGLVLQPKGAVVVDIRHLEDGDYGPIVAVINDWWGGRQMAEQLPRIFFVHSRETSFAIAEKRTIVGFLAGFVSQTYPEQAYIHFVGIHPDRRAHGLGRRLYSTFFDTVRQLGCTTVFCVTSAVNKGSIAFHKHMGFEI